MNIQHKGVCYSLRQSNESDVPLIRKLVNSAYQELADMGLNYTATYQDEEITRNRVSKGRCYILFHETDVVGTVLFTSQNYFTNRRTGYVSQLAIHPLYKSLGLGTLLMNWCEELAQREGFEAVQLDTAKPAQHLVKWYLGRGYTIVGETHWEGKTYQSWIFEKSLLSITRETYQPINIGGHL